MNFFPVTILGSNTAHLIDAFRKVVEDDGCAKSGGFSIYTKMKTQMKILCNSIPRRHLVSLPTIATNHRYLSGQTYGVYSCILASQGSTMIHSELLEVASSVIFSLANSLRSAFLC